jgi:hypothetical protein
LGGKGGTIRGRWHRMRRLDGAVCAAISAPGCRVEKKAKEKGVPAMSPDWRWSSWRRRAVSGHCCRKASWNWPCVFLLCVFLGLGMAAGFVTVFGSGAYWLCVCVVSAYLEDVGVPAVVCGGGERGGMIG